MLASQVLSEPSALSAAEPPSSSLSRRCLTALGSERLQLPVLPTVIGEVLRLCEEPDTTGQQLSQRIQSDPSLAGNLLRIANSAAYRGAVEVVSLNQAIARLGFATIRDISLSVALSSLADSLGPFAAAAERVSHQSLATALWSRTVARGCRKHVEDAYLCGLLRHVGSMLILRWLGDESLDPGEEEVAQLHSDCARYAGQQLVASWELPSVVGAVLEPEPTALEPKAAFLWWVVDLAGFLAGQDSLEVELLSGLPAVPALNLYPEDLAQLAAQGEALRDQLGELRA